MSLPTTFIGQMGSLLAFALIFYTLYVHWLLEEKRTDFEEVRQKFINKADLAYTYRKALMDYLQRKRDEINADLRVCENTIHVSDHRLVAGTPSSENYFMRRVPGMVRGMVADIIMDHPELFDIEIKRKPEAGEYLVNVKMATIANPSTLIGKTIRNAHEVSIKSDGASDLNNVKVVIPDALQAEIQNLVLNKDITASLNDHTPDAISYHAESDDASDSGDV